MDNVKVNEPYALVFGNEANGVSEELKSIWKGQSAHIEIDNVESLNLAIAASIAMYKFK
jgi:tRNA G18 (ribose-2'-O)-methylase SpoU